MSHTVRYSLTSKKIMLAFQKDELTSSIIYTYFADKIKGENNKKVLRCIGEDEKCHAEIWKDYTKQDVKPNFFVIWWYKFLTYVLGCTFIVKLLERKEYNGVKNLELLIKEVPEVEKIIQQEKQHEQCLINMLDEERLNYVGAMVLGLNDALVELTGTIAGLTFVLMNTTLIAMAGVITGIAATLSMAASNYLAERANGSVTALKASVYTGVSYLITVICLVMPYLLFPETMFIAALVSMIVVVVLLIAIFNFYVAVVRSEAFLSKFLEMAGISLSVALISFVIGLAAKTLFGIDIG